MMSVINNKANALLIAFLCLVSIIEGAELILFNRSPHEVQLTLPVQRNIDAGDLVVIDLGGDSNSFQENTVFQMQEPFPYTQMLPGGVQSYALFIIKDEQDDNKIESHDTNDLQVDISNSLHQCDKGTDGETSTTMKLQQQNAIQCVSNLLYGGGLSESLTRKLFRRLWIDLSYWRICNAVEPAKSLRSIAVGNYQVEILRESPLVATARQFLSLKQCDKLLKDHTQKDNLVAATVGTGGGKTSTSSSRETLTHNIFINWDEDNVLSQTGVAGFDLVSELIGQEVGYEAQEPINFLHYLKGFEYRPHQDGSGDKNNPRQKGKRVATTLIYCEAATEGGGTVFPKGDPPLRFQPQAGDLLFFEYAPQPMLQTHAACPVIKGYKSTFTQWYRLGVTPDTPWDDFEDWGKFGNPYANSRWKGPRYGKGPTQNQEGKEEL